MNRSGRARKQETTTVRRQLVALSPLAAGPSSPSVRRPLVDRRHVHPGPHTGTSERGAVHNGHRAHSGISAAQAHFPSGW